MADISEACIPNGRIRFNNDLYYDIRKARKERKYPEVDLHFSIEHPLIGKKVIFQNKEYRVEGATKEFYAGWFIRLKLVNANDSHRIISYANINCIEPSIMKRIEINNKSLAVEN